MSYCPSLSQARRAISINATAQPGSALALLPALDGPDRYADHVGQNGPRDLKSIADLADGARREFRPRSRFDRRGPSVRLPPPVSRIACSPSSTSFAMSRSAMSNCRHGTCPPIFLMPPVARSDPSARLVDAQEPPQDCIDFVVQMGRQVPCDPRCFDKEHCVTLRRSRTNRWFLGGPDDHWPYVHLQENCARRRGKLPSARLRGSPCGGCSTGVRLNSKCQ